MDQQARSAAIAPKIRVHLYKSGKDVAWRSFAVTFLKPASPGNATHYLTAGGICSSNLTFGKPVLASCERFFSIGGGVDGCAHMGCQCFGFHVSLGGFKDCTGGRKATKVWHFKLRSTMWRYIKNPALRFIWSTFWHKAWARVCLWIDRRYAA